MAVPSREELLNRVASVQGHLAGVRRMVEQDVPCPRLIFQLRAVRKALSKIEERLVEKHVTLSLERAEELREDLADEVLAILNA